MIALTENALVPATRPAGMAVTETDIRNLIGAWLAQLAESSRKTYLDAWGDFVNFLVAGGYLATPDMEAAISLLITAGKVTTTDLILAYREELTAAGKSPNTQNLRVTAIRSLLNVALERDMISWSLRIRNRKATAHRDTRGPGTENLASMLSKLKARGDAKGARDVAILRLMYDCGLRRSEVIGLDLEHFDGECIWVLGKGRVDRIPVTLPQQTKDAIADWVRYRGDHAGPLFQSVANRNRGKGRLRGASVFQMVSKLGRHIDIRTSPHRIRHTAVTTAVAEEGLVAAQKFARHTDPKTTMVYEDNLEDVRGRVARTVAATL